jgi:hypothetical protein
VARSANLRNPAVSDEFRRFEGEAKLLVWCAWRVDGPEGPVSSWDSGDQGTAINLECLMGTTIISAAVRAPAWDLDAGFSTGLILHIFCDHLPPDPSFDGNWELWLPDQAMFVGPGTRCRIEPRTQPIVPAGR